MLKLTKQIYWDLPQNSPEWHENRIASLGGSNIATATAKGKGGGKSSTRETLLTHFAAEINTGFRFNKSYRSKAMDRGHELEPQAAFLYDLKYSCGKQVQYPGLIRIHKHLHCSPDLTIGLTQDGSEPCKVGEIKCVWPNVYFQILESQRVPPVYRKQCQWNMLCCGADTCDFIVYCPEWKYGSNITVIPFGRNQKVIDELLAGAEDFINEAYARLKNIGSI